MVHHPLGSVVRHSPGSVVRHPPGSVVRHSPGSGLVHGDFHPGNVLWRRGRISGVVDWQAACTGLAVTDVAHCRVNLMTFGPDTARRFTDLWERSAGISYHPWADVVAIIGFLDDLRDGWGSEQLLVEDMLVRAVSELGAHSR